MTSQILQLSTEAPFQCLSLTADLHRFVQVHGERDGAVVVATQHTTTATKPAQPNPQNSAAQIDNHDVFP